MIKLLRYRLKESIELQIKISILKLFTFFIVLINGECLPYKVRKYVGMAHKKCRTV